MHRLLNTALFSVMMAGCVTSYAVELQLTLDIPQCRMPPGKPLPTKYYALAEKWKEYRWVRGAKTSDRVVSGSGDERVDGSGMFDWYTFGKLDINGDNICDWFLTSLAPYSTGGDSGVLNTLYMGSPTGWARVGATIPKDKPDGLGWGNSSSEQANFAFSSNTPLTIWDLKTRTPYLIGWFDSRHTPGREVNRYGYRIYTWNKSKNTLQELDKWDPTSTSAQVYAYFKQHGAVDTTQMGADRIAKFDPELEKVEFNQGCKDEETVARSSYFAQRCRSLPPVAHVSTSKTKNGVHFVGIRGAGAIASF